MCILLITQLFRLVGRLGARKPVSLHQIRAVVTLPDRLKSVRNCCQIDILVTYFLLFLCFHEFSVIKGAFVIELRQISSFFPLDNRGSVI